MLLKPAVNDIAYIKAGLLGLPKSGKSYTAMLMAIGVAIETGRKKPIAFYDTEGGSGYLVGLARRAKVEIVVCKSRSFSDLIAVQAEAERDCCAYVIDSVTHPWVEFCDTYLDEINKKRKQRNWNPIQRLEFQHWQFLKRTWRQKFTEPYLNTRIHTFMCGRAGWEYEYQEVEKNGKMEKELIKGDVKMKAEAETGYEPSLLLWLEREFGDDGHLRHRCVVLGDRFDAIQGKEFIDPSWNDFKPYWNCLAHGAEHLAVDTTRNSSEMIDAPNIDTDHNRFQRKIQIEEIEGHLQSAFPGKTAKENKMRADLIQVAFNTRSETAMTAMTPDQLLAGKLLLLHLLDSLNKAVANQEEIPIGPDFLPWLETQANAVVMEEELPDHPMEVAS